MDIQSIKNILKNCNNQYWKKKLTNEDIEFVYSQTSFYKAEDSPKSLMNRRYYFLNDCTDIKRCMVCGKELNDLTKDFCSKECLYSEKGKLIIKERTEQSNLKKFGTTNPMKCDSIKNKMQNTIREKYGVDNISQSETIKKKKEQTFEKNYGCSYGQSKEVNEKYKQTIREKYGVENISQLDSVKEKKIETTKKHYGVESPLQSDEIKEKAKKTNNEIYGFDYPIQNETIHKKIKETTKKRFGVETPFGSKVIKEKIKNTFKSKYGCERPIQNEEIKQRIFDTTLKKYGVKSIFQSESFRNESLIKQRTNHFDLFVKALEQKGYEMISTKEEYINAKFGDTLRFKCCSCGNEFEYTLDRYRLGIIRIFCPKCFKSPTSKPEQKIFNWLSSLGVKNIERNKRDWNGQRGIEADIYLSDYNLAIEYNGLYWHSNLYKDSNYHYNKWKFFKDIGIDCIQIFENEWNNKPQIVKNIIMNKLGMNNRIYARKCVIKNIPNNEYELFLEQNHLQGYCKAKVRLGLYYNDELVMIMSFSKPRFNKNYDWENIRTCSKVGYNIVGGFSKLLKHFKENYGGSIISYVDKRYFNGNGYINNGFSYVGESKPNYFYFKSNGELNSRDKFQKHKLKNKLNSFDKNLTEKENMLNNGWNWIYDCGNLIYEF